MHFGGWRDSQNRRQAAGCIIGLIWAPDWEVPDHIQNLEGFIYVNSRS
jgi:hypothetical protein